MTDRYVVVLPVKDEPLLLHCYSYGYKSVSLKDLQKIVEGHIECVPVYSYKVHKNISEEIKPVLVVNEEGKMQSLGFNRTATAIDGTEYGIAGNAVLMATKGDKMIGFLKNDAIKLLAELEEL